MPYKPVPMDQTYKPFEKAGWYRLRVASEGETRPTAGFSSGGYAQVKVIFLVDSGEYEGNRVYHDILIPPLEKAYKQSKHESTGEAYLDRNKPTFWMLKTGWTFQVFGIDISKGDEVKNLTVMQSEVHLTKIAALLPGKEAVGYVVPTQYENNRGEQKIKGVLKELRHADYKPEGGFADDVSRQMPPATTAATATRPAPAPRDVNPNDGMAKAGEIHPDVKLDPDLDLGEEDDFYAN